MIAEQELLTQLLQSPRLPFFVQDFSSRLASEARARCHALDTGRSEDLFRGMLPEAPMAVRERG